MNFYHLFGLHVVSELELPELITAETTVHAPDVKITFNPVPERLTGSFFNHKLGQTTSTESLLKIDSVGRFYIKQGREIVIERCPECSRDILRLYVLGSCFGALLHQRKLLPLHASAICHNGKAVLFTGRSKAGKSTTAHALVQKGYPLHTDDICVIGGENGQTLVYPGYPQMKMWADALDYHGLDTTSFKSLQYRTEKYAVPMLHRFNQEPVPLERIYILRKKEVEDIEIHQLTGMKKFIAVRNNTYRYGFLKAMRLTHANFEQLSTTLNDVPVKCIVRPTSKHTLDELVSIIELEMQNQ